MTEEALGRLHPELARGGRLADAIANELRTIGSAVVVEEHLNAPTSELEQAFPEIEICAEGRAHERGALVDFQWTQLLAKRLPVWPDDLLHDVFALAATGRFRALAWTTKRP